MKITKKLLKSLKACDEQVELFNKTFPSGTEITKEACLTAASVGIDFDWACNNLLNCDQRKAYEEAKALSLEAYEEADASLWKAYEEAKSPLWEAYEEAKAPLWKAYEEALTPLWKAYKEANAPLWKAYKEAKAIAFYNAYHNF